MSSGYLRKVRISRSFHQGQGHGSKRSNERN